jgi:magnesium-transporting ATPase (P-type)
MSAEAARLRYCYKCGYQAPTAESLCPQCRGDLQLSSGVRIRGILMVLLGGALVGFMSWLTMWAIDASNPNSEGGARFTGSDDQLFAILALFALIIVFGFASALTGFWQIIFGRRNKLIVWGALGFAIIMGAMTYFVYLRLE